MDNENKEIIEMTEDNARVTLEDMGKAIISKPLVKNGTNKILARICYGIAILTFLASVLGYSVRSYDNSKEVPVVKKELQEHKEDNVKEIAEVKSELKVMHNDIIWLCRAKDPVAFEAYKLKEEGAKTLTK
jgi:hypothetical protein